MIIYSLFATFTLFAGFNIKPKINETKQKPINDNTPVAIANPEFSYFCRLKLSYWNPVPDNHNNYAKTRINKHLQGTPQSPHSPKPEDNSEQYEFLCSPVPRKHLFLPWIILTFR